MRIGDIVIPANKETVLASGSGRYDCAIVANLDPFVLVSIDGDMLWQGEDSCNYKALCMVNQKTIRKAIDRYRKDFEPKEYIPYNETFGNYHSNCMSKKDAEKFINEHNKYKGGHWILRTEKEYKEDIRAVAMAEIAERARMAQKSCEGDIISPNFKIDFSDPSYVDALMISLKMHKAYLDGDYEDITNNPL